MLEYHLLLLDGELVCDGHYFCVRGGDSLDFRAFTQPCCYIFISCIELRLCC